MPGLEVHGHGQRGGGPAQVLQAVFLTVRVTIRQRGSTGATEQTGDIDRPVYVVCKITNMEEVSAIPTLHEIGRKNGFVFFQRLP